MDPRERDAFIAYSKLPTYQRKVERAKEIIREAIAIGPAYVAVSWGKDSVALLHLCQQVQPDILAVHFRAPLQDLLNNYEQVIGDYLARFQPRYEERNIEIETLIPSAVNSLQLWGDYPVSLSGIRAQENPKKRGSQLKRYGAIHQYRTGPRKGSWRAWPLAYWRGEDIWAWTVQHDLPYLRTYDSGSETRLQARTCNVMPFTSGSATHRHGRIAKMKVYAPEAYAFIKENYPEFT